MARTAGPILNGGIRQRTSKSRSILERCCRIGRRVLMRTDSGEPNDNRRRLAKCSRWKQRTAGVSASKGFEVIITVRDVQEILAVIPPDQKLNLNVLVGCCRNCSSMFITSDPRKKYCNLRCFNLTKSGNSKNVCMIWHHICNRCERQFVSRAGRSYTCGQCRSKVKRIRVKSFKNRITGEKRTCILCLDEFRSNRNSALYCSAKCGRWVHRFRKEMGYAFETPATGEVLRRLYKSGQNIFKISRIAGILNRKQNGEAYDESEMRTLLEDVYGRIIHECPPSH
jgi:hypothetical protein